MIRIEKAALFLAGVIALGGLVQRAAALEVGDKAPDWSGIVGVDDKDHGLADYKNAKAVAIVFTCNHCPVAKAYEDRLVALQKKYKETGVQLIAVNVNNLPADKLDKMKERAEEKEFNFPYLYDETQKIGHDYGATVTPHVFLLDGGRKVAYMGAIDDNIKPDKVSKNHLADAIDAVLAGETPAEPVTKQFGCAIKYEK